MPGKKNILEDFLRNHQHKKVPNSKSTHTHTRIGNKDCGLYGGSYFISEDELDNFYRIYMDKVFNDGTDDYLTERQAKEDDSVSPILIDLDFKYDETITKRQHNASTIESIIGVYLEKMKTMFHFNEKRQIPVYVFEKKTINRLTKDDKVIVKDGIHLLIGVQCERKAHTKLRELVIEDIGDFLNDLPLTNSITDIVDDSIATGNTNWQLYGSKKPGNERYNLTYHYNCTLNDNDEFELLKKDDLVKYKKNVCDFKKLSAHYKGNVQLELKPHIIELFNTIKPAKVRSITREETFNIANVTSVEHLERICEELMDVDMSISANYIFKETHDYLMIIDSTYSDNYKQWIEVGWALKNTDDRLFISWMLFSAKSQKYKNDFSDVNIKNTIIGHYEMWKDFKKDDTCLTSKSIGYWAKSCYAGKKGVENKWETLQKTSIEYYIDQAIKSKGCDYDMGLIIHCKFKEHFILADHKNNVWFVYNKNRWNVIQGEPEILTIISSTIYDMLQDKMIAVVNFLHNQNLEQESKEHKQYEEKITTILKIASNCRNESKKKGMLASVKQLFYDKEFIQKSDQYNHLLSFDNGVFDFNEKKFRTGRPEDYITIGVGYDYIPIEQIKTKYQKEEREIKEFFTQIYPQKELSNFIWELLASLLIGGNLNQKFYIFIGKGSNGKSIVMDLIAEVMGEYCGVLPAQLITNERHKLGGTQTEMMALKNKRIAIASEPRKGDKLNDGVMKELTGGTDKIVARGLYSNPVEFIPQFKPIVCTNNLYDIADKSDGVWRRIDKVDHISYFTDEKPDPSKNKFAKDKGINKKFASWKAVLMSLLVEIACVKQGIVTPCDIVSESSKSYRNEQDITAEFINARIVQEDGVKISRKGELYQEFKLYITDMRGGKPPSANELYTAMDSKFGLYSQNKGWKNCRISFDDDNDDVIVQSL